MIKEINHLTLCDCVR